MIFFVKAKPYQFNVHFLIGESDDVITKYVYKVQRQELTGDDLSAVKAITFHEDKKDPVICLQEIPYKPKEFGVFIHEVYHACQLIGEYVGMKRPELAGETFAYFLEDIVVKALTKIQKENYWPESIPIPYNGPAPEA